MPDPSSPDASAPQAAAASTAPASAAVSKPRKKVRRAIGPKLRPVLRVVWVLLAIMAINSGYLGGISLIESLTGSELQTYFFQWMFLVHIVVGLVLALPFLVFAVGHMRNTHNRRNRRAVRVGYVLFAVCLVILFSGLALLRLGDFALSDPRARSLTYWLHVGAPVAAVWLYSIHRLVGPKLQWKRGVWAGVGITAATLAMAMLHHIDPTAERIAPAEGAAYFEPSLARTAKGTFIPSDELMNDAYCLECHADTHADWALSAHRFSSFNNPAYLASIRETREAVTQRDGSVKASRWCAGCHDPVPLFSGAFDDPAFDDRDHPTASAGITCTVCHAIEEVPSTRGNADYVIDEPIHYPMADSPSELLHWVSNQLVKANPSFHKKSFLKPVHKSADFCATCHKVHLPGEVTDYRPFLRGQNHYDSWLLSGVSGHGARSFYYPATAQSDCNGCHMPRVASDDFGKSIDPITGELTVHSHLFPAANTAVAWMVGDETDEATKSVIARQQAALEGVARVDLFGVRLGNDVDDELLAPLRPSQPADEGDALVPGIRPQLVRGQSHLLEAIIRTLKVGHHFTQGTIDSNEIWLDLEVRDADGQLVAASGQLDDTKAVDPGSHFVNAFVVDRDGYRINRRNAQDIFVKLYDHQIPPGAGQAVHYRLDVPEDAAGPLTATVKLQYRKFDQEYMQYIADVLRKDADSADERLRGDPGDGQPYVNELPITTIATDAVTFELVDSVDALDRTPTADGAASPIVGWQRWNDYGIGLLLKGKAQLKQAAEAFGRVAEFERYDGPLNLARTYLEEGRLDEATAALAEARTFESPAAPPWTVAWLSGRISRQQGYLEEAITQFDTVLTYRTEETLRRGFDFSLDYVVWNDYGQALFDRAKQLRGDARADAREAMLKQSVEAFERTLAIDPENATAHYNLALLQDRLGDAEASAHHRERHAIYKPNDNARDRAERLARERYPFANRAAEPTTIYPLSLDRGPAAKRTATASRTASTYRVANAEGQPASRRETPIAAGSHQPDVATAAPPAQSSPRTAGRLRSVTAAGSD